MTKKEKEIIEEENVKAEEKSVDRTPLFYNLGLTSMIQGIAGFEAAFFILAALDSMEDGSKLKSLRKMMRKKGIDLYMVFLADYHASETVVDSFFEVEWLSGFSGTNATIIVSQEDAGLWTDGRYFIQANRQLFGSGIRLFAMGEEGVPDTAEYIKEHLPMRGRLGFDARLIPFAEYEKWQTIVKEKRGRIIDKNLIDILWKDRPSLPKKLAWELPLRYSGRSAESKLKEVFEKCQKEGADGLILASLYDIAWLLNIRGSDISHVPVPLCFFCMTARKRILYIAKQAADKKLRRYLRKNGIKLRPYEAVFSDIRHIGCYHLFVDKRSVSAALINRIPRRVGIVFGKNPTALLKAKKNRIELENTVKAHIKDGIAVTRFICYIKTHIGKVQLTECSAADILHRLRARQNHFLDESFDTISAYGANAAMMHYEPDRDRDVPLLPKGFLLVDSGGHYLEGTTDITRTICLGEVSEEERKGYTLALKGMLALMGARFPKGTLFQNLDALARGPFWNEGLDYRCGTGHGVGHILNVHEGPNSFRWRITDELPPCEIEPGMITTDEPGLYVEDEFGIRIENELLCVPWKKTEYGRYLAFRCLTLAPIDLDAADISELSPYEKKTLNSYHRRVYRTLCPYLSKEEAEWLKSCTQPV